LIRLEWVYMTYTIENFPDDLDRALRMRAVAEHKSPEAVIVDLVTNGLAMASTAANGSDAAEDDSDPMAVNREFQLAIREQRLIEWDDWSDNVKRRDLSGIAGRRLITPEMETVFAEQRRIDPEMWK
jgi:plasmid stability protein